MAVDLVAPRADSRGDVVALYAEGPVGDAEEKRWTVGCDFVLWQSQSCRRATNATGTICRTSFDSLLSCYVGLHQATIAGLTTGKANGGASGLLTSRGDICV